MAHLYRLWLGTLDCGVVTEENAQHWLKEMRAHGYEDVRMEPTTEGTPEWPVPGADDDIAFTPSEAAVSFRCPACGGFKIVPGFDQLFIGLCPHCGQAITPEATRQ